MTDRIEIKAALAVTETGEISGIAWPFGSPDLVGDVIEKGAFDRPASLPMLHEHDGGQAVGVWSEITETDEGLTVKGKLLVHDVARAREVADLIRAGEVGGLSIGFITKSATRHAKGRNITALSLREISVVKTPCNPGAHVVSLKSVTSEKDSPVENEDPKTPANAPEIDTKALNAVLSRLDKLEAKSQRVGVHVTGTDTPVMGADEVKAFSHFLRTGDRSEVKSLAYGAPSTGGILAPETVSNTILEKVAEFSPVRGLAQVIAMNGPLLQLPRLVDEVNPQPVAEGAAKPESEPTFEQIDLKPFEIGVVVPVTKILLEDAQINLASYLANHVARRFGQKEAAWFVNGNGTTQAEGLLTAAEVSENEVAAITSDALIDHFYSLKTTYSANGSWLMNRATMAVVRKLKDADGAYIWQGGIAAGQPATLLGRPVYEAVDMPNPTEGNTPIVFGDFATGYAIADRVGFEILRDDYTGAVNGIVKLIARRRVGGRVVMGEALSKLSLAA